MLQRMFFTDALLGVPCLHQMVCSMHVHAATKLLRCQAAVNACTASRCEYGGHALPWRRRPGPIVCSCLRTVLLWRRPGSSDFFLAQYLQAPGAFMMTGVGIAAAHTLTDPPAYLKAIIAGAQTPLTQVLQGSKQTKA